MKYKYLLLPLILIIISCNDKNTSEYDLLKINNNLETKDGNIKDIPDFYFENNGNVDNLISFRDTLGSKSVEIKHTGEKWGDKAQIYKGASYIKISFPSSLKVFSYDWPQPAISSNPVNTSIISGITDDFYFTSPIIIELEHKFRNPISKKSIEQQRTFETGIGLGFKDDGKVTYYILKFISKVNLKHSGQFIKYKN
jgi:hypothetical protein